MEHGPGNRIWNKPRSNGYTAVVAANPQTSRSHWSLQLSVLWGVQLVDVLVVTSLTPAIPRMLASTDASQGATTMLAAATAMAFAGLLLLGARLGDRFGHRRVLLAGMLIFAAASAAGATADGIAQLVIARVGQGTAAALCLPAAMWALLGVSEERRRRRTALAGWSACGAAAGILGYVVGGGLTQALSWHWVFWINLPIAALLLIGILAVVPPDAADRGVRLDVRGAVYLTAAVMSLVGGASILEGEHWLAAAVALAAGCGLGWLFVRQQRRAAHPLIPESSRHDRNLRTGVVVSFINTATSSGIGILVILLLQNDLGIAPARASLIMMPFSAAVVIGSLASRLPSMAEGSIRPMVLGLGGIGLGALTLAVSPETVLPIVAGLAIAGAGLGLSSVGATSIGTGSSAADVAGDGPGDETRSRISSDDNSAVGLLNTSAQLGNALGVAALLGVSALPHSGPAFCFLVVAVVGLLSAVVVGRSARSRPHSKAAPR
jgi:MFS family permease